MMKHAIPMLLMLAGGLLVPAGSADADDPVWPPASASAPAEVAWQGSIDELRPKGLGRIFRAVAGAGRRGQDWQLAQPVAVAFAGERVFIVDTALGWVVGAKPDGRAAIRLKLPDDFQPVALAAGVDRSRLYVADRSGGAVLAFAPDGEPLGAVVPAGVVERCGGIAICADGDVVMTDAEAGQVVRVRPDGREVARTGRPGTGGGEFNTPTAVAEAPDGAIWVLDTFNFRVQRFDPELRFVSAFGEHGDGSGHIALAKGLAVDPDGHVYLTDARFDVIQVFDADGRLLFIVGGRGHGTGELWNPAGLVMTSDGMMAVADTGNRRIQLMKYRRKGSDGT